MTFRLLNWAQFQQTGDSCLTGFSSGRKYRGRPEYYKGDIKWITSGELNYNIITDTFEKITEEAVSNTNLKILPKGTFLIAITGLEAEGTRGRCGVTGVEATTNQSCMALFPKVTLDNGYLYHFYVWQGKTLQPILSIAQELNAKLYRENCTNFANNFTTYQIRTNSNCHYPIRYRWTY